MGDTTDARRRIIEAVRSRLRAAPAEAAPPASLTEAQTQAINATRARLGLAPVATPEAAPASETVTARPGGVPSHVAAHMTPEELAAQIRANTFDPYHPQPLANGAQPQVPEGMVYNPETGQMMDTRAMDQARDAARTGTDAAISGAFDMVTLGYGPELLGFGARLTGGPEAGEYVRDRGERALQADAENHPWAHLGGQIAGGLLLPAMRGAGWLRNIATGTAYAMAYGSGSDNEDRLGGALRAIPGGIAGGAIASAAGAVLAPATRAIGNFARSRALFANGRLTDAGRSLAQQVGLDPDAMSAETARQFAADAARAANPEEGAAAAPFREFNIPAYRHNVTGTVEDAARFHGAARGGRGAAAEARVRPALEAQDTATRDAAERIATDLSGGRRGDQLDAAVAVQQGLRAARDGARNAARQAYEDLEAAGGLVGGAAVKGIADRIAMRVRSQGPLRASLTPQAAAAMDEIAAAFRGVKAGRNPFPGVKEGTPVRSSVPFMELERLRQSLVKMDRAATGADEVAMGRVMDAFDEEVENLITNALISGDDVIPKAQNARALWSAYARQFKGEGAGSRFIQRMIHEDASPDEAVRWLFGASKLGGGGFTSNIAGQVKSVLGEGSDEWAMVRQAAWRQLAMKPEGTVQPGPQQMSERILGFLNGAATRPLASQLFSAEEQALMRRYAGVLKRLVPPAGAVNHSASGYEVSRMAQATFRAVMTALATTTQGPAAGMATQAAGRAAEGAVNRAAARGMLRPYSPAGGLAVPPGAGVPVGGAAVDGILDWMPNRGR